MARIKPNFTRVPNRNTDKNEMIKKFSAIYIKSLAQWKHTLFTQHITPLKGMNVFLRAHKGIKNIDDMILKFINVKNVCEYLREELRMTSEAT